jgi:hypothetical protein
LSGAPGVPLGAAISTARQLGSFLRKEEEIDFKGNDGVRSNWILLVNEVVDEIFLGIIRGVSK